MSAVHEWHCIQVDHIAVRKLTCDVLAGDVGEQFLTLIYCRFVVRIVDQHQLVEMTFLIPSKTRVCLQPAG